MQTLCLPADNDIYGTKRLVVLTNWLAYGLVAMTNWQKWSFLHSAVLVLEKRYIFAMVKFKAFVDMSFLDVLALIAGVIGIIGSIVPGLPGPPISWLGQLLVLCGANDGRHPVTLTALLVWFGIMVLVTVLDYIVPAQFTKMTGGSKSASWGALIGLVAGMIIPPVGMIFGALLGAFLAELFSAEKSVFDSMKASLGVFLGFVVGTGMKLIVSGLLMYYIIVGIF